MKNYYQILGISKVASQDEVKQAYRKLAHQYHPDKGGDEKKFKEINEAYQVLSSTEKRAQYDKFGRVSEGGNGFDGFERGAEGVDFDLGDLGEMFGEMFGFGRQRTTKDPRMGKDIEIDIELPLEATLKDQKKEVSLYKMVSCSRCHGRGAEPGTFLNECFSCRGTGRVQQIRKTILGSLTIEVTCPECGGEGQKPKSPCNVCKGKGAIKGQENIEIVIPAGIDTNQIMKVTRKGESGIKGGEPGDLYIRIHIKRHSVFARKGDDLYTKIPISFSAAALGAEIEVLVLEGTKILLKVPSGTESGKVLRVSGKGIPHFSNYGRGNLYVELDVKTPKKLSKKQKELLEKLREEGI